MLFSRRPAFLLTALTALTVPTAPILVTFAFSAVLVAACSSSSNGASSDKGDASSFGDGSTKAHTDAKAAKDAGDSGEVLKKLDGGGEVCVKNCPVDGGHTDTGTSHTDSGTPPQVDSGRDTGTPTMAAPLGAHSTGVTIQVPTVTGNVARTYDITVPATCDASAKIPLLFAFHGDGGNGAGMYSSFPIEAVVSAAGASAIFVYPDGTDNNIDPDGAARAWDLYHDPGYYNYSYTPGQPVPAMNDDASGNVDVDFFDAMVEFFETTYPCIDKDKVWITGMSSGGYLANQFARWRPTVVKATAPQSGAMPFGNHDGDTGGTMGSDWQPPNYCVGTTGAIPVLIVHGLADGTVDPCNSFEEQSYWDTANGCPDSANNCQGSGNNCTGTGFTLSPPAPTTTSSLDPDCKQTTGCGAPVVLCQVPGMGHQIWENSPTVIWQFFSSL